MQKKKKAKISEKVRSICAIMKEERKRGEEAEEEKGEKKVFALCPFEKGKERIKRQKKNK